MSDLINYTTVINTRAFDTAVPEYYERNVPVYYEEHGVSPIFETEDLNECNARSTISDIVDMTINEVPFRIINPNDISVILDIIYKYLQQVAPYVDSSPALKTFVDRITTTRNILDEAWKGLQQQKKYYGKISGEPLSIFDIIDVANRRRTN